MRLEILFSGIALFSFALFIHVCLWRKGLPKKQILSFFFVFLSPALFYALMSVLSSHKMPWVDFIAVMLLYVSLSVAYVQTYPAVQALSPSLRILLFVGDAASRGLSEEELLVRFNRKQLLEDRIQDLIKGGFVRESTGQLEITPKGSLLLFPGLFLRKLLGLTAGRG